MFVCLFKWTLRLNDLGSPVANLMRMDVGSENNEQQPQLLKAKHNGVEKFLEEYYNSVCLIWDSGTSGLLQESPCCELVENGCLG